MSDLVCVMNAGRIVQLAPPQEVYDHPARLFVADFVGKTNRLSRHRRSRRQQTAPGRRQRLACRSGRPPTAPRRPCSGPKRSACVARRPAKAFRERSPTASSSASCGRICGRCRRARRFARHRRPQRSRQRSRRTRASGSRCASPRRACISSRPEQNRIQEEKGNVHDKASQDNANHRGRTHRRIHAAQARLGHPPPFPRRHRPRPGDGRDGPLGRLLARRPRARTSARRCRSPPGRTTMTRDLRGLHGQDRRRRRSQRLRLERGDAGQAAGRRHRAGICSCRPTTRSRPMPSSA